MIVKTKILPNAAVMSEIEATIGGGERVLLTINSGSMYPFLEVGDVVELDSIVPSKLRRGDIVLFRYNNQHILHRIRHIRGNRLIIMGDGNYHKIETATRNDVAARAVAIIKSGKRTVANSCRWHRLTAASLTHKFLRDSWYNLKGVIIRYCSHHRVR